MDLLSSGYEFLVKGGPVMWPLLLASVLALGAAIERYLLLRGALDGAEELIEEVSRTVLRGTVDEARGRALRAGGPVGRVMAAGLDHWHAGSIACEKAMEERGMIEREALSKRLVILDTVITVAPLLGLLGTVTGMIKAFEVVGAENQIGSPTAITGGVAEALIATATGLFIAIVTLVIYNYLNDRVRQVVGMMEIAGTRIVNLRTALDEASGGTGDAHCALPA